jgi:omega-6 fatty acid desaturase (delta-12 desaturase)
MTLTERSLPGASEPGRPSSEADPTDETGADGCDKPGSLLPVIRAIPASAYDNPTWKGLAYFARALLIYGVVVAGLVLVDNPLLLVPLWALASLAVSGLFIIGHDAAHESLFQSRRLNSIVGHLAMLPSWHVYEAWVLGHNRIHHGHTAREGMDFVWHPLTPQQFEAMSGFQRFRHRIEWSWWGAGAYYLREIWLHKMITFHPPAKWAKAIRRDLLFMIAGVGVAFLLFGWLGWAVYGSAFGSAWMIVKVVVIPFLGFNFVIGSVVHVHHIQPDIRWYPRREWTKFRGQVEGTTILRAPKVLDLFFHSIFVHVPHHVDMRIPFYGLEPAAAAIQEAFPESVHDERLRFSDFVRNSRICKLYDFERGRWMTYDEAMTWLITQGANDSADRARFRRGTLVG